MICSAVFTSTQKKNSIWNWFIDLFKSNSTTTTAYNERFSYSKLDKTIFQDNTVHDL